MSSPRMVAIGHVTWDLSPGNLGAPTPGGAVAYTTMTAGRLGIDAAIVTAAGTDYPIDEVAPPEHRHVIESEVTTTFANLHDAAGIRHQRLMSRADSIGFHDVPEDWRKPDILYVGPLTQELPPDCLSWFTPGVSCVVPQGWCRKWNESLPSEVTVIPSPPAGISTGWDICVVSEQEVRRDTLHDWLAIADHVVVTQGERGATLHQNGDPRGIHIPAALNIPNTGTDTTGAGDVFAAAMAINYANGVGIGESARDASEWAARSTTAQGWHGI